MRSFGGREEGEGFSFTYFSHFAFVYIAFGLGVLLSFLIVLVIPAAGEAATISGRLVDPPVFLPGILAGLLLGRFAYQLWPSKLAFFAWLLPAGFLLWSAWSWQKSMSVYDSTWDTYFGKGCGGSECLYELFLTAPFCTSLAYSLGAFTMYIVARKQVSQA